MTYTEAFLKIMLMDTKDFVGAYNSFILNCGGHAEAYIYHMRDFSDERMKSLGGRRLSLDFDSFDHYWYIDCAGCAHSSSSKAELISATDCIDDMIEDMRTCPENYKD